MPTPLTKPPAVGVQVPEVFKIVPLVIPVADRFKTVPVVAELAVIWATEEVPVPVWTPVSVKPKEGVVVVALSISSQASGVESLIPTLLPIYAPTLVSAPV